MAQYLKHDSELGYIENIADIENAKFNNARHVVLGCMLGDFDETGAYVVAPEIVSELLKIEKYVVDSYDNIEICKSVLKLDKQISFMITYEGNKATLSLIEKLSYEANFAINSGTYSNINEYVLDVVETVGEVNRNALYRRWNIGDYGGNIIDIFSCDDSVLEKYFGIVNRFKYLLEANKELLDKEEALDEIEAGYTNAIFEILKHYPKLNEAVLKTIKETLTENKNSISVEKPNFVKTFNEVLENAIQKNIKELNENELREFNVEKENAVKDLNIKRTAIVEFDQVKNENADSLEASPKIIQLKTENPLQTKSVSEVGTLFVSTYKRVVQTKISKAQQQEGKSETKKLLTTLVGAGLGAMVGGTAGVVAGAVTANVVAKAAEEVKVEAKKAEAAKPAAKADAKKPAAKKPAAKKAAKKPAAKKPAAKKTDAKSTDAKKKEVTETKAQNTTQKKKTKRRIIPQMAKTVDLGSPATETTRKIKREHMASVQISGAADVDFKSGEKQKIVTPLDSKNQVAADMLQAEVTTNI